MAARFEHRHAPQMVEPRQGIAPPREDRGAFEFGIALFDDPDGFARGVHVDNAQPRLFGQGSHPINTFRFGRYAPSVRAKRIASMTISPAILRPQNTAATFFLYGFA
jgi:hypothetical protein